MASISGGNHRLQIKKAPESNPGLRASSRLKPANRKAPESIPWLRASSRLKPVVPVFSQGD